MVIEELLKEAQHANTKLSTSIQQFEDCAISAALENLPSIINASLAQVQKLIDQEILLKAFLQSEMLHIRKLVESKIGIIEAKGTQFLEKMQALALLEGIFEGYLALYEYSSPSLKQSIAHWQGSRLRLEQQVVCKEKCIEEELKKILAELRKMAEKHFLIPNRCFISYAWADNAAYDEKWVQPFLKNLETHLSQAGITVLLDIKKGFKDDNLYQYMRRIKQSDCVIIVGTQALLQQHDDTGICNELILINENRAQQQSKTLSILLSGCLDNVLPPYFMVHNKVSDWRENSYINNLKNLLANIYDIGIENTEYQKLWKGFEESYPVLITGFSEKIVHQQLTLEAQLASQKELTAQRARELFEHINESLFNQSKINNLNLTEQLSWEVLIKCAKDKYKAKNKLTTIFGEQKEITDCCINLAIIEKKEQGEEPKLNREERLNNHKVIRGMKTLISSQDVFVLQSKKELKRQLILGRAGVGKSVMSQYFAHQWTKEAWWKDTAFKLLVWIPLCQLTNEEIYFKKREEGITLGKVFYEQFKEQLHAELPGYESTDWIKALDSLIKEHCSEVLYVLDGFDEVAHICQLTGSQATYQTHLLNLLLNQEQVVITSRPYYIDNYLNAQRIKIDRRLENIGFMDKDIQDYVAHYAWDELEQPRAFQLLLSNNSLIREMAYIPINLILLCHYWSKQIPLENSYVSMTDLYEGLVDNLLHEPLREGKEDINFLSSVSAMSNTLNNKSAQLSLQFLERLAFLQMQEESLVISKKQVTTLLEEFKGEMEINEWQALKFALGASLLISSEEKEKRFEDRREHFFIHLTFQEFLAARYIIKLFTQKNITFKEEALNQEINHQALDLFIQEHKYDLRYETVWWFVAGLLKNHKEEIDRFFNSLLSIPRSLSGWYDILLWIKCLEESKLTSNLSGMLKESLISGIRAVAHSALDSKARISEKQYSKTFFEYLYSSPIVYEKLKILPTPEALKKVLYILEWDLNLPASIVNIMGSLLRDENEAVKSRVLAILSQQPNLPGRVLEAITSLIKNETTRRLALFTLSQQSNLSDSVLEIVISLLRNKDETVRRSVLFVLGQQSSLPIGALKIMVSLPRDEDSYVRYSALSILGRQPNLPISILEVMVDLLRDEDKSIRGAVLSALSQQSNLLNSVLGSIISLLEDENWSVRCSVLEALAQQPNLPNNALEMVISLLRDENWSVRCSALEALAQQSNLSNDVLELIIGLLKDEHWSVRRSALFVLDHQPNLSDSVLKTIVSLMRDEHSKVRCLALSTLGRQSNLPVDVVEVMISLLKDENEKIRYSVLLALSQQHLPDSVLEVIVSFLRDEDWNTRCLALEALTQQNNLPNSILEIIISLLEDENEKVRRCALPVLSQQPNLPNRALEVISSLLKDENEDVRCAALLALGQQLNLSNNVIKLMKRLLKDENEYVRCAALYALEQQPNLSSSVEEIMVSLLKDENCSVRHLALQLLGLGKQADLSAGVIGITISLLRDENEDVRCSALEALDQQPNLSNSAIQTMVSLLQDKNWSVRYAMAQLLGKQLNLSVGILKMIVSLLSDENWNVRYSALEALNQKPNLPASVLKKAIILNDKRQADEYDEEIDFINQQLALVLDSSYLQSRLSSRPRLLSKVILENTFSSKNVVYFENDQSLVIRLGQKLARISIKDKKEFLQEFIQQRTGWLNNKNMDSLVVQMTDSLSGCYIA